MSFHLNIAEKVETLRESKTVFPKVGDIAPLGALELSRGAMKVTSSIRGHWISKRGGDYFNFFSTTLCRM